MKPNKVWTRLHGLVMTNWSIEEEIPLDEEKLNQSLMYSLRTKEPIFFNDKLIYKF